MWTGHLKVPAVLSAGTSLGSDIGGKAKATCAAGERRRKKPHMLACTDTDMQKVSAARQGGFQRHLHCRRARAEASAELSARSRCSWVKARRVAQVDSAERSHRGAERDSSV